MTGSGPAPAPVEGSLFSLRELTGTVIDGRYRVGELLGCGGMGAVYEGMQLRLDRPVAIKILNPVFLHRDEYVERFMQEARTASRIRHDNVVQMLDFGSLDSGLLYSVMELLEGCDLAQVLGRDRRLPWAHARSLLLQAIRGLKAAHGQGVIHRDIKPANLFVTYDAAEDREVLKVVDFGIARAQSVTDDTAALTGTADFAGTPAYMAPELARGRGAGPRSEVYSVGVVAFRMLTGRNPFSGDSPFDILFHAATEPVPPMPEVPAAVEAVVHRMLAKDPRDRFADMADLYREVAAIDGTGRRQDDTLVTGPLPLLMPDVPSPPPTVTGPIAVPRPRRPWPRRAAVATGGAAVVAAIALATLGGEPGTATRPPAGVATSLAAAVAEPVAVATSPGEAAVEAPPVEALAVPPPAEPEETEIEIVVVDEADAPEPEAAARRVRPPPTDGQLLRRLKRRAKARCGALLGDAPLQVTFGIGQGGEVLAPRASRRGPATDCVLQIVGATRFTAGGLRKEVVSL